MGTDSKPEVHHLAVADYSLGPLDFATPALGQVHALTAVSYSLGPLAFDVPVWRQGYWRTHIVWGKPGHPPCIPVDAEKRMIAATEIWLTERQITNIRRMSQADRAALKGYVRGLAKNEGVQASDLTLHRQIIKAAFRNITARAVAT